MSTPTDNEKKLPGYTPNPEGEDMYTKGEKEPYTEDSETADLSLSEEDKWDKIDAARRGENDEEEDKDWNEKGYGDKIMGGDLDVPGSDLDDDNEAIGEEDEENNFYSISDNEEGDDDE